MAKDDNYLDRFKGPIAEPYKEPKEENPRDFIKGFGTPMPPSIEKRLEKEFGRQSKKSGC
jgi:hypothetical protein